MSTVANNNPQRSARTSEPAPRRRTNERLETELTQEAADARAALTETAQTLAEGLIRALDPRPAVTRHPLAALGIGAAGGLVAGMLLGRKATRRSGVPNPAATTVDATAAPITAGVGAKSSGISSMLLRAAISAGSQFVLDALMKQAADHQAAAANEPADSAEADYDDFPRDEV